MDPRQLECFVAVAEELNLSRAAARLHIAQPPLTRRIRRLEDDIGTELFRRTAGGMQLTESGAILLERAYRMIALSERAIERVRQGSTGELGTLDIGYYDSAILDAIPALLRPFSAQHPHVQIRLERTFKREQVDYLRDKILHLAFGRHFSDESGISTRVVAEERLLLAVNDHDTERWPGPVQIEQLRGSPLIVFPPGRPEFADEVVHMCLRAGFSPTVAIEAHDVVSAMAYVAIGRGPQWCPSLQRRPEPQTSTSWPSRMPRRPRSCAPSSAPTAALPRTCSCRSSTRNARGRTCRPDGHTRNDRPRRLNLRFRYGMGPEQVLDAVSGAAPH
ncbi:MULTISPECIES: LysR family transcriptional regulator [unclassified Nocardioides]|uniref:LysR family transcriptional regulator n=1 Tax=unclassified Nocardioides TaxID=2615069 RepID=UPI002418563F|nr:MULTISPECIES: LysR substrate-binding domain-containing protein [unclassified Nocardioides]